jgi:hypothetical protein
MLVEAEYCAATIYKCHQPLSHRCFWHQIVVCIWSKSYTESFRLASSPLSKVRRCTEDRQLGSKVYASMESVVDISFLDV